MTSAAMNEKQESPPPKPPPAEPRGLPIGYRQGLITAITILLGFSLAFLRFWGFEAPGKWTLPSVMSTGTSIVAVVLELIALFRSLRPEDDDENEYRRTVMWFIAAAITLLFGFLFAFLEVSLE